MNGATIVVRANFDRKPAGRGEAKDPQPMLGVTRSRVSQIAGLTLLAPAIQEAILTRAAGRDRITERRLREIVAEPVWEQQMALYLRRGQEE